jgi:predicted phage-related endonuclease
MRAGREMEPFARIVYEELTGNFVINPCYQHDVYEWAMCSPDGITYDERTLLEIKCSEKILHTALSGEIPEMYKAQCWWGMWITGAKKCHYFAYYEGKHALIKLEQNQEFIDKALPKAQGFYAEMISINAEELAVIERSDDRWVKAAYEYINKKSMAKAYELEAEAYRQELIKLANGRECTGAGVKLIRTVPKGTICYSNIPELLGVDLEMYRKPSKEVWTVREIGNE